MDPFTMALLASVAGSAISGGFGYAGAQAQGNAAANAANTNWQIYQDQARRNEPWRQSGINALNFQNQWLGLSPVSGKPEFTGTYNASDWGAGAPVNGHSNAKDQWTTLGTGAPDNFDYEAYWNDNPDFATAQNGWNKADNQALFDGNRDAYLWWHYNNYGKNEGRTLKEKTPTDPAPADEAVAAASQPKSVWDTIQANPLWTGATKGFLGVDVPEINGAFATGGKLMSGAKEKALQDRSTARSYNALTDIYNQYGAMSGTGFNATQATNQAASAAGANNMNAQLARGNALASGYGAIGNAVGNGLSSAANAYFQYGPGQNADNRYRMPGSDKNGNY